MFKRKIKWERGAFQSGGSNSSARSQSAIKMWVKQNDQPAADNINKTPNTKTTGCIERTARTAAGNRKENQRKKRKRGTKERRWSKSLWKKCVNLDRIPHWQKALIKKGEKNLKKRFQALQEQWREGSEYHHLLLLSETQVSKTTDSNLYFFPSYFILLFSSKLNGAPLYATTSLDLVLTILILRNFPSFGFDVIVILLLNTPVFYVAHPMPIQWL